MAYLVAILYAEYLKYKSSVFKAAKKPIKLASFSAAKPI